MDNATPVNISEGTLLFYSDITLMNFIQSMNTLMKDVKLTRVSLSFEQNGQLTQVHYNSEGQREVSG